MMTSIAAVFLAFTKNDSTPSVQTINRQIKSIDSLILSYRAEYKAYIFKYEENDQYYEQRKLDSHDHYSNDSINNNRRSDSLIDWERDWTIRHFDADYLRSYLIDFKSADSLFSVDSHKYRDCMHLCFFRYKNEVIKIKALDYEAMFDMYYANGDLIYFDDYPDGPCKAYRSHYHARFYFDHGRIIGRKIRGRAPKQRREDFGNRRLQNVYTRADSILDFSAQALQHRMKNVIRPGDQVRQP